ncbi:signal peptidase II [Paenibacillus sp. M1]|uniref:Lipoprotein signal peptidase n=1 Tax=Paenibacillus haidiansis TaxID=1574488 RepID=A0ABU7VPR2_9BACL
MLFYLLLFIIVFLDQITKLWVRFNLALGQSLPVWDGFQLTHYQNTGAMGSSFQGYGRYFIIPAVLVVISILYLLKKGMLDGFILKAGAACFAGGAIGNAIDRLLFGRVTDFLDFGRGISNFADHAISLGFLLILISELILNPLRNKKKTTL